jgi:hypothetical protein
MTIAIAPINGLRMLLVLLIKDEMLISSPNFNPGCYTTAQITRSTKKINLTKSISFLGLKGVTRGPTLPGFLMLDVSMVRYAKAIQNIKSSQNTKMGFDPKHNPLQQLKPTSLSR